MGRTGIGTTVSSLSLSLSFTHLLCPGSYDVDGSCCCAGAILEVECGEKVHTKSFFSPVFETSPGNVFDPHQNVEFPEGHLAIRSFICEMVDADTGEPIPLSQLYVHHWFLQKYGVKKGFKSLLSSAPLAAPHLPRKYASHYLRNQLHRISFRPEAQPVQGRGCFECVCDLYNVTVDVDGHPLPDDYKDNSYSNCPDSMKSCGDICVDAFGYSLIIVRLFRGNFLMGSLGNSTLLKGPNRPSMGSHRGEYDITKCTKGTPHEECIHTLQSVEGLPMGGDLIFAVLHQHSGGLGGRVFNEAGDKICESLPIYGQGDEAGNEAGFVVGMSPCNPKPGSVNIRTMEALRLESNYSNVVDRTGVMGIMKLYVAESVAKELEPLAVRDIKQVVNSAD
ncbi:hypothetical protein AXG93_948s1260 [Marchantia polymorpha subsp. ruderalis]|uniref:Uncharacterized protein n=1 Tax=Marchantia polymorpha subsp. ruderalis TaxID=1480154 RepID=A0A176VHU9_MARPO|nr:hypothetical protein AXG93_948s1260 [Marchantia polymorpha subsp. ruderalis]